MRRSGIGGRSQAARSGRRYRHPCFAPDSGWPMRISRVASRGGSVTNRRTASGGIDRAKVNPTRREITAETDDCADGGATARSAQSPQSNRIAGCLRSTTILSGEGTGRFAKAHEKTRIRVARRSKGTHSHYRPRHGPCAAWIRRCQQWMAQRCCSFEESSA